MGTRRFLYDGSDLVAEYNSSGTLLRRYVHGPSAGDDPLVWFEGSGVADSARRYLYPDERGSIVAVTDSSGNVLNVNTYDEYGIPGSGNAGTFQYTGQAWLPELGMYYYKARMYSPTLGRFMQTDPIGYGDGMNIYAYVKNDPVNFVDPSGLGSKWGCITVGSDRGCGWHWDGMGIPSGGGSGVYNPGPPPIAPGVICASPEMFGYTPEQAEAQFCPYPEVPEQRQAETLENDAPIAPCSVALTEPGGIETTSVNGAAILGVGLTGSIGRFRNVRTGTTGYFATIGMGAGADGGISANVTVYGSLRSLVGLADNVNLSLPNIGGYGSPTGSYSQDLQGNPIAGSVGAGIGLRVGASGTMTDTTIFRCTLGNSN